MKNMVVVGVQWGDEGKGKIVDLLAEQYDIIARYGGGHNAGHTVKVGKNKFVLDASAAKIMVDGKPAEFQDLRLYTVIHVKFEARKSSKDGINLDGVASEIRVNTPENFK